MKLGIVIPIAYLHISGEFEVKMSMSQCTYGKTLTKNVNVGQNLLHTSWILLKLIN